MIELIKTLKDKAKSKGWDETYWAFDLHKTLVKPSYKSGDKEYEWYPYAKECLQILTKRKDVCLILFTA